MATLVGNIDLDIQSEICYIRFGDDAMRDMDKDYHLNFLKRLEFYKKYEKEGEGDIIKIFSSYDNFSFYCLNV